MVNNSTNINKINSHLPPQICHGQDRMVVGFITTRAISVVSSTPAHGEVYSIQYYVIKFVSDLRQVGGFLWVL